MLLDLRGRVMTKGKTLKTFQRVSRSLMYIHGQYLWTFLIDLQAEVLRFRCVAYFLKI